MGLVACGLLALAIPGAIASSALIEGDEATELLRSGKPLTTFGEERVARSRTHAARWIGNGSGHADLSLLDLRRSYRLLKRDPVQARQAASRALEQASLAVALSPGDVLGWYFLAYAGYLSGDSDLAGRALSASYRASPYFPQIMTQRIHLALSLRDVLPPEGMQRLRAGLTDLIEKQPRTLAPVLDSTQAWSFAHDMFHDEPILRHRLALLQADREQQTGSGQTATSIDAAKQGWHD